MAVMHMLRQSNLGSKLEYAIGRISDSIDSGTKPLKRKYDEDIEDLRIKHAMVYTDGEKKGALMRDNQGQLQFSPEGTAAFNKEVRVLNDSFMNSKIEVTPYFAQETWNGVKDVEPRFRNKLVGLLFETGVEENEPDEEPNEEPEVKQKSMQVVHDEPHVQEPTSEPVIETPQEVVSEQPNL
jgi:hypothetical protein